MAGRSEVRKKPPFVSTKTAKTIFYFVSLSDERAFHQCARVRDPYTHHMHVVIACGFDDNSGTAEVGWIQKVSFVGANQYTVPDRKPLMLKSGTW